MTTEISLQLINNIICESRLFRFGQFRNTNGRDIANLLYLNTLLLLIHKEENRDSAEEYARKTSQYGSYTLFRTAATDLYILAYETAHPDNTHIRLQDPLISKRFLNKLSFDAQHHLRFVRSIGGGATTINALSYLIRLEDQLKISDNRYKTWRRTALTWRKLPTNQQQTLASQIYRELFRIGRTSEASQLAQSIAKSVSPVAITSVPGDQASLSRKLAGAAAGGIAGNIIGKKLAQAMDKPTGKYKKIGTGIGAIAGYWAAGKRIQK